MDSFLPFPNTTIITGIFSIILIFSYFFPRIFRTAPKRQKLVPEIAGGWPLIGHLPLLRGPQLPHIILGSLADKYGPIFRIRMGVHSALVISSSEVAKECYTTNDGFVSSRPKFAGAKHLGYNYANFGFAPYGAFWRDLRKIAAAELLSNRRLDLRRHVRVSEVKGAVKDLYRLWTDSESNDSVVEMKQWMGDINLNVILQMVCGKRFFGSGSVSNNDDAIQVRRCRKLFREWFALTGVVVAGDALPFLGWLDLGGYEKAMKKTAKELDDLVVEWLEEHRQNRDSGGPKSEGDEDFMDILLSVLRGIDLSGFDADTVNKATCSTILAGATDTTTVTLTWALSLLLNSREVLRKVQEELDIHVGKERLVDESDVGKLVYLHAVIKETLRLCPAGPLSGPREFTENCTIAGYHVPAGTRLLTNLWKIQTDPQIWADPLKFKPERFLTTHKEVDVRGQHFELIPFGAGRRSCPGITFGLQMTHLVLASLIHAFEITTPMDAPVDMTASFGLTNIKSGPLEVVIKPRLSPTVYE